MIAAITAVLDVIKSFLGFKQTEIEHKPVLDVVKDKKSLKKGTNYAEQILEIASCNLFALWHFYKLRIILSYT